MRYEYGRLDHPSSRCETYELFEGGLPIGTVQMSQETVMRLVRILNEQQEQERALWEIQNTLSQVGFK